MTGNDTPHTAAGPPWPLELLADLHAGVFDPRTEAELRAEIATDPAAVAALAALDATVADLAALPPLPIPDHVAARIDQALHTEATTHGGPAAPHGAQGAVPHTGTPGTALHPGASGSPVTGGGHATRHPGVPGAPITDLAAARERRRRRGLIAGTGLLAAAAAVVGVIAVAGLTGDRTAGTPQASPSISDEPRPTLTLTRNSLNTALDEALAAGDYGPLAAAGRLDACLAANGIEPGTVKPLGAREVNLDGRPGVLLILPTGVVGRFRILVVAPDCGPGNRAVLADADVGRR